MYIMYISPHLFLGEREKNFEKKNNVYNIEQKKKII